ncbi:MAG TPA: flagellar assembly protein FliW [Candidatus Binatia bacterium]|nr:flagellar assembly protein FliW [Candidatus Binatia bacterium]
MAEPARKAVDAGDQIPVHSRRFGDYEVPADRLLHFPEGLIGFPHARRFALLDGTRPDAPFRRLLCVDEPELGFVVCDPEALWPGYGSALPPYEGGREHLAVLALVTIPKNPVEMTANLMAPLVVDCRTRVGRQVVLDTGRFSTRHPVLPPADAGATAGGGGTR